MQFTCFLYIKKDWPGFYISRFQLLDEMLNTINIFYCKQESKRFWLAIFFKIQFSGRYWLFSGMGCLHSLVFTLIISQNKYYVPEMDLSIYGHFDEEDHDGNQTPDMHDFNHS